MKKKVLFIDRDGTLIVEPSATYQIDTLEQLEFLPHVLRNLYFIRHKLDFEWAMVSNQDGLGTPAYPQEHFDCVQAKMLQTLRNEGITFDRIFIDKSRPEEGLPTRKPGTGMLTGYIGNEQYDLPGSFVIGDRATDVELARNLGCRAILLNADAGLLAGTDLQAYCALQTTDWNRVAEFLFAGERRAHIRRTTRETDIDLTLNLDGTGQCAIGTGLHFLDHMLEQIGRHAGCDLSLTVRGDREVDEHHTV